MLKLTFALLVLLINMIATTAQARIKGADNTNPVLVSQGNFTSTAGESLDAFVLRVAKPSLTLSRKLKAEVCGEFTQDSAGQYSLTLYTVNQALVCYYDKDSAQPNYTGFSFHTHLSPTTTGFSDNDFAQPGYLAFGQKVLFQAGAGTTRRVKPQDT